MRSPQAAPADQPDGEMQVNPAMRSTIKSFSAIVDRIEAVVDAETEALTQHRPIDMGGLILRKRQGLLELSRIMRAFSGLGPQAEAQGRLNRLSGKLERNRIVLDRQLRAVREVADIIAASIKEAESDGTYTKLAGRT